MALIFCHIQFLRLSQVSSVASGRGTAMEVSKRTPSKEGIFPFFVASCIFLLLCCAFPWCKSPDSLKKRMLTSPSQAFVCARLLLGQWSTQQHSQLRRCKLMHGVQCPCVSHVTWAAEGASPCKQRIHFHDARVWLVLMNIPV